MIISKTPLRISFTGGGTDIGSFYETYGGRVVSTAIDKYVYVIVKRRFDRKIQVTTTDLQGADQVRDIRHDLVREALNRTNISSGVDVTVLADIPGGTGLGSSSSLTVGLLHALYAFQEQTPTAMELAAQACELEINTLGQPIGKQDQYAAALGGLRSIWFHPDGSVEAERLRVTDEQIGRLQSKLLLFYTGISRSASAILHKQSKMYRSNAEALLQIKEHCALLQRELEQGNDAFVGTILNEGWQVKKKLADGISNAVIDDWYTDAVLAGAAGGKVAGAGGGGFLLLYADEVHHASIRRALPLQELAFAFDSRGTRIMTYED